MGWGGGGKKIILLQTLVRSIFYFKFLFPGDVGISFSAITPDEPDL